MTAGADLRAMREAGGFSLNRMARSTHFTKSYLSMVETGKRSAVPDVVAAYEHALGVPASPVPSDPLRVAHEWLVSTSPLVVHTRSGRRVGASVSGLADL